MYWGTLLGHNTGTHYWDIIQGHSTGTLYRDTALGVKADVDGLLAGFDSVEHSLNDLDDKLQNNMDLIDNLTNKLIYLADLQQ